MKRVLLPISVVLILFGRSEAQEPRPDADVLVVGAGISGLSAALEAARGGATVLVVDMWSIFGGHAVVSHGGLCIVGTPVQEAQGVVDSPELAKKDFLTWGEDASEEWVDYYVRHSRGQIYDWVTSMGVEFYGARRIPGNSVARFHEPIGRGLGLVSPIYRQAVLHPSIRFEWNFEVDGLTTRDGRVVGAEGEYLRSGERGSFEARFVVLATGGFQSNLDLVRAHWPESISFPERLLAGSGVNSQGSGLGIAQEVGAALHKMDHQWNYATGLPDPRYPGGYRGLNATNNDSIWVNAQGERFTNERGAHNARLFALLQQEPARYWAIFDETAKRTFAVTGSDWADFRVIEDVILSNEELVKKAPTLEALAEETGLPGEALKATVARYNRFVEEGADRDFGRFGPDRDVGARAIVTPPFYAATFFPLARKSMGGLAIDIEARVLDKNGEPIDGLLAAGEVSGFGGINGRAGLEGTFLGPSIVTGRVAGRTILKELSRTKTVTPSTEGSWTAPAKGEEFGKGVCATCHDLSALLSEPRRGYSHFEKVHGVVVEKSLECQSCHGELYPIDLETHRTDPVRQIESCKSCHIATEH